MSETESLFEGIATIKTFQTAHNAPELVKPGHAQLVEYDVYAKISVIRNGPYFMWEGTFEIMGEDIPQFGGDSRVELSDGRQGEIIVRLDEGKTGSFRGKGMPPGYYSLPKSTAVTISHTPRQTFRRVLSNTLFAGSAALLTAGLWIDGRGVEFAGTGAIWIVMAIATQPKRQHSCQPIEGDNDGHPDE